MFPNRDFRAFRSERLYSLITCVVGLLWVYVVVSAILVRAGTVNLDVSAPTSKTVITITGDNLEAKIIGTGKARVRIAPGSYEIVGFDNGSRTQTAVQIYKGKPAKAALSPSAPILAPTVDSVDFQNFDALINDGITTDQLTLLRQYFFAFKKTERTVAIAQNSITSAPHNPATDTSWTMYFTVQVDGKPYNATITYSDPESIQLVLIDPQTNTRAFDSSGLGD